MACKSRCVAVPEQPEPYTILTFVREFDALLDKARAHGFLTAIEATAMATSVNRCTRQRIDTALRLEAIERDRAEEERITALPPRKRRAARLLRDTDPDRVYREEQQRASIDRAGNALGGMARRARNEL